MACTDTAETGTPLTLKSLRCANGEAVEYSLYVGPERVAGPVWTSNGTKEALRQLLRQATTA